MVQTAAPIHIDRFIQRLIIDQIIHERRYFPEDCHPPRTAIAFGDHRFRSATRCHYSGTGTARSGSDNQYIRFGNHRNVFFNMVRNITHKFFS